MTDQPYIELDVSPLARLFTTIITVRDHGVAVELPVELEAFDTTVASVDDMVEGFMSPEGLRTSGLLAQQITKERGAETDCCVYVIAQPGAPASKLGRAVDPVKRRGGIQSSHWDDIRLYATCWAPAKAAHGIETLALRLSAKVGRRLKGEWVAGSPQDVAYILAAAAHSVNAPVADGMMWVRNRRRVMLAREAHVGQRGMETIMPKLHHALYGDALAMKHTGRHNRRP